MLVDEMMQGNREWSIQLININILQYKTINLKILQRHVLAKNVFNPSIEVLYPFVSLDVRMQYNGTSQTREMKVKVSNVTRWKNQDVPRLEFDHQSQLIKNNLTIFPVSKWNDNTKKVISPVTMSISGDTEVDDNSSKGVADGKITKAEISTVGLDLLICFRHIPLHL